MLNPHPSLRLRDLALRGGRRHIARLQPGESLTFTYQARSAIFQFCRSLPNNGEGLVLVPAFHCPTVVEPILRAGCRVAFYRIHKDLSIDYEDLVRKVQQGVMAVLVIHYCGFPVDLSPILATRGDNKWFLIEDWSHSFLDARSNSLTGGEGDCAVYSFYKQVPTFVGGGLRITRPGFTVPKPTGRPGIRSSLVILKRLVEQAVENSDATYVQKLFLALERKRIETFRKPTVDAAPDNYEFDENLANSGMPALSKAVLDLSDWPLIVRRRRELYRIWAESLRTHPGLEKVFDALPESVCPWAFPVLMDERARYDYQLRARGVPLFTFGETLHPLLAQSDPAAREDAQFLSRNLLMLSVDQRLSDEVIAQCCRIVNEFYDSDAVALR